eukprot:3226597-Pyramimonas_sp.AAC.1
MASFVITTSARVACIARNAGPTAPQKPMRRAVAMSARCADAYRKTRLTQMCGDYRRVCFYDFFFGLISIRICQYPSFPTALLGWLCPAFFVN